jgi:hypothetical protein
VSPDIFVRKVQPYTACPAGHRGIPQQPLPSYSVHRMCTQWRSPRRAPRRLRRVSGICFYFGQGTHCPGRHLHHGQDMQRPSGATPFCPAPGLAASPRWHRPEQSQTGLVNPPPNCPWCSLTCPQWRSWRARQRVCDLTASKTQRGCGEVSWDAGQTTSVLK